jgi:hypothetical protein
MCGFSLRVYVTIWSHAWGVLVGRFRNTFARLNIHLQNSSIDPQWRDLAIILLEAIAGGVFIFMTFLEILAHERENDHSNLASIEDFKHIIAGNFSGATGSHHSWIRFHRIVAG